MRIRLLIRGFDKNTKPRDLEKLFSKYGRVVDAKIRKGSWRNKYGYSGAVVLLNELRAELAVVNLNGTSWRGRTIWVRWENRKAS